MFKDRYISSPYLIRELPGEMSFAPQIGDKAFLLIDAGVWSFIPARPMGGFFGQAD